MFIRTGVPEESEDAPSLAGADIHCMMLRANGSVFLYVLD
jgi:hypothetical protein